MLVVIDYDETFTAHKSMWTDFVKLCRKWNVPIVCCTARSLLPRESNYDILTDMGDLNVHVVFAGEHKDKWESIEKAGYIPENAIWVDDRPMDIFKND